MNVRESCLPSSAVSEGNGGENQCLFYAPHFSPSHGDSYFAMPFCSSFILAAHKRFRNISLV